MGKSKYTGGKNQGTLVEKIKVGQWKKSRHTCGENQGTLVGKAQQLQTDVTSHR